MYVGVATGVAIAQKINLTFKKLKKKQHISMVYMVPKRNSVLAPYSAKTELTLAPYGAKNGITFWHHMVPHGASWCQKVPKRGTQK